MNERSRSILFYRWWDQPYISSNLSQPVAQLYLRYLWALTAGCWLVTFVGCGSWLPEMVPYGAVSSPDVNRSLNGLGLHRELWETSGARCLTPQQLSPKLNDMDVVVLIGQSFEPPGQAARQWLEDWLAAEAGRTVIYFGRDFNADIHYRRLTLPQLAVEDQPRGRELLALREVAELNQRLRQLDEPTFCGWFYLDTQHVREEYDQFIGQWVNREPELNALGGHWPVQVALLPPDNGDWLQQRPQWIDQPREADPLRPINASAEESEQDTAVSQWEPSEIDSRQEWDAAIAEAPESEVLLAAEDGQPLVFRLTSERFSGSQILIVTNGAPLLNGSLVLPLFQRLGEMLIDACLPAQRVALLAFDDSGLTINNVAERDNRAAGLEMLTVWPLSGITMPAALFGIIVCTALVPILGRPQSLVRRSVSDFGLHVDAIGRMLYEARDIQHAKSVIAEYFRKVRRESPPEWLESTDSQP